jgi:acetyl esterase/lipase
MDTRNFRVCVAGTLLFLAACGTDSQTATISSSTARGTLVANPPLRIASVDAATLTAQLNASPTGKQLLQLAGAPACGVDFNYMHYWTIGGANEVASASGALMVPTGAAPACSGPRPILLYAHGTQSDKNLNIADPTDPNNQQGALLAAMFAAQGYIVVAPNYTGYDTSDLPYHPYVNAVAQSADMIDALAAARSALGKVLASSTTDNGRLFITGYSQGGYVAMATHRAMQAAGMKVTASAPMSGPYALAAFADAVFLGHVSLFSTGFAPLLTTSFQKSYGNVYKATTDVYEAPYASGIEGILPSATPLSQLLTSGKLPPLELFNSNTPGHGAPSTGDPVLDGYLAEPSNPADPNTPLYRLGFGTQTATDPGNLITNAFRIQYVGDALLHPDGALVPNPTNPIPAATPALPLRQDLKLNDLRGWMPAAPVFMCGGSQDPVVYYQVNTLIMAALWQALIPMHLVTVLDLETTPTATDPFAQVEGGFQLTKAAIFTAAGGGLAGQNAVVQSYHSTEVPFCAAAARGFFATVP